MLIDALVAIAIMAVMLVLTARVVSDGGRRTAAARGSALALMEARSRLAEVGADIPLQSGETSGDDAGLAWHVLVLPAQTLSGKSGRAYDVTVQVAAGRDGGGATLRSRLYDGG